LTVEVEAEVQITATFSGGFYPGSEGTDRPPAGVAVGTVDGDNSGSGYGREVHDTGVDGDD
jgi:hypothetical protein